MYAAPQPADHPPAGRAGRAGADEDARARRDARACSRWSRRWTSWPIACGLDPIELRIRNEPDGRSRVRPAVLQPESGGLPAGGRPAVRLGGARRPAQRRRREAGWLVGTGVAAPPTPPTCLPGSAATVRVRRRRALHGADRRRRHRHRHLDGARPRSPRTRSDVPVETR